MDIYQHRKDSFKNFTQFQPSEKDIENFARAGLYVAKRSTQCFLCDFKKSDWKLDQSPFDVHAHDKPNCPWVVLEFPGCLTYSTLVFIVDELDTIRKACAETFKTLTAWSEGPISIRKLSKAGFFYSPTEKHPLCIRCPYCFVHIKNPNVSMDFMNEHEILNKECPFIVGSCTSKAGNSNKRKHKGYNEYKEQDDEKSKVEDVWSIEHAFKPPLNLLKPNITYSKKRRTQSLLQPLPEPFKNAVSKRNPQYSTKKHVNIVQSEPSSEPTTSIDELTNEQVIMEISSSFDDNVQISDEECKVTSEFNNEDIDELIYYDDMEESIITELPSSSTKGFVGNNKRRSTTKDVEEVEPKDKKRKKVDIKKPAGKIEKLQTKDDIAQVFMKKKYASGTIQPRKSTSTSTKTTPFFTSTLDAEPVQIKGKGRSMTSDASSSSSSSVKKSFNLSRRKKEPNSLAAASTYFNKIPDGNGLNMGTFKNTELMTVSIKRNGSDGYMQTQTTYYKDGKTNTFIRKYTL